MNGIMVIISCVLLLVIMKKMIFPSNGGLFGASFFGGENNFLGMGKEKEKVKELDKPAPSDPAAVNQNNPNNPNQQGMVKIPSYEYLNLDNRMIDTTDGTLNINLGENQVERLNINGERLKKALENASEPTNSNSEKSIKNDDVNDNFRRLILGDNAKLEQNIGQEQLISQNVNQLESGKINEHFVRDLKEIKGPVKSMLVNKFTAPEGVKVENLVTYDEILKEGASQIEPQLLENGAQQIIENVNSIEEIGKKPRLKDRPKIIPFAMLNLSEPTDDIISTNTTQINNNQNIVEGSKIVQFTGHNQLSKMNSLGSNIHSSENAELTGKQIQKMNEIVQQLVEEDKKRILRREGHTPYLTLKEANEINQNKQLYSNIYRIAQISGLSNVGNKEGVRRTANKVISQRKEREEVASRRASNEVEKRMSSINRDAFYQTMAKKSSGKDDSFEDTSLTANFISYMSQYVDIENVEPSESERKEYMEQAIKNMEARKNMSPEAVEEEYNRIYNQKKEEKILDKIFSNNSEEVKEVLEAILSVPELGISIFGEDTYYNIAREVDNLSSSRYKELYNEIRVNIMDELNGGSKETVEKNEQEEQTNTNKSEKGKNKHRASYEEFLNKKKQIDTKDINNALGIGVTEAKENEGAITPIKTYQPNVIDHEKKENIKAV